MALLARASSSPTSAVGREGTISSPFDTSAPSPLEVVALAVWHGGLGMSTPGAGGVASCSGVAWGTSGAASGDAAAAGLEGVASPRGATSARPWRSARRHLLLGALAERRFGRLRVFINAEDLLDVRQTKYDPLILPAPRPDGRWTVDAWAPLDGRVVNGGVRVAF
jgi:hypothetical protein